MERKRIYILVKTYPTISEKYSELVCTAGVLEDGSWIRLYPIPFRLLNDDQKYPKYTWIEVNVERNIKDFRPDLIDRTYLLYLLKRNNPELIGMKGVG